VNIAVTAIDGRRVILDFNTLDAAELVGRGRPPSS